MWPGAPRASSPHPPTEGSVCRLRLLAEAPSPGPSGAPGEVHLEGGIPGCRLASVGGPQASLV